jgi:drug/metabolite transporter (DMT)-like permease
MISGYPFLAVAVLSFGVLGVLHKVADYEKCRPTAVTGLLFLWAGIVISIICLAGRGFRVALETPLWICTVAAVCGIFASVAILNFQRGIRFGRISTSWLIINLSTAVPVVLSILIYKEHIKWKRSLGLTLALVALLLLWSDRRAEESALSLSPKTDDKEPESRAKTKTIPLHPRDK